MRWVRSFLLAMLISTLVGLAIGTWLRLQLEKSPVYIGSIAPESGCERGRAS